MLVQDKFTGKSRGFAFVTMGTDDDAQNAITQFHGKPLDGRNLTVNEARPREDRPRGGGGGYGGGGGGAVDMVVAVEVAAVVVAAAVDTVVEAEAVAVAAVAVAVVVAATATEQRAQARGSFSSAVWLCPGRARYFFPGFFS